ncbi:MAG TPA: hypothetical protein VHM25_27665 [Polyangiaceae bacterium]|jgi:hypothetical protein|nr:hypothetical protein [Polyangiaceae bacterium]
MKVHGFAAGLLFAALSVSVAARAQTADSPAPATVAALPLKLELGSSKLDAEAVRKAVELELKRPVVLAASNEDGPGLSVTAHPNRTVTVSYRTSTGETRARSIGVPEDAARAAEVIALLSGNLSRDEAAELLADLAAKANPAAAASAADAAASATPPAAETPSPPTPAAAANAAETRPPPSPKHAPPSAPPPLIQTPFPALNLSLWAPVALYRQSEQRIFTAELGLFYSHVGELHGGGLNLFVLHTERDARGLTIATFYNYTGGKVQGITTSAIVSRRQGLKGLEVAGVVNLGSGDARGVAAAGLINTSRDFEGVQAAGLLNRADRFQGVQAAGLLNRGGASEGMQAAGLGNLAGRFQGIQVAGAFNRAGAVTGVQAAGAANVAESISGLQIGVVNVAREVRGMQLGVVNVAKRVEGTSIGLVSVAGNGRVQPVVWASSAQLLNAAVKFTVGPIYTQAGLGYAPGDQTYSYELGLGAHLPIGRLFVEPGVHYSELRGTHQPFDHELIEYGHYRVAAGLDLGGVSPFAGVGVLQRFAHSVGAPSSVPVSAEVFGGAAFF